VYLRALGAKIGKGVTIFSAVPVCTDLLTIGEWTIIRKDASRSGYRARAGRIQTGHVWLGSHVLIGEHSVLDIDTTMGDGAQLGHSSSLHRYQIIPDGQSWHGSPAQRTSTNYKVVEPVAHAMRRRVIYSTLVVFNRLVLVLPLGISLLALGLPPFMSTGVLATAEAFFYLDLLALSAALYFPGITAGLIAVALVPRLLNLFLKPDRDYPLYGIRYLIERWVVGLTNIKFFMQLAGDSSLVVHYLGLIGYKQPGLKQTGSNFGVELKQDNPLLTTVGSGTMVS
ncbi:peptide synthetase, partial [Arthrobacter deserti]|nr:peptide synthetase [Arthrobacter deserti]